VGRSVVRKELVNDLQAISYHNGQEQKHAFGSKKQPSVYPTKTHTLLLLQVFNDTRCLRRQAMRFFHKRMWQTRPLDNVITGPLRQ
jgi:hypothetical protein